MPFLPFAEILRLSIRQAIEVQQVQMMFVARVMAMQGALRRQMLPAAPKAQAAPKAPTAPRAPAARKAPAAPRAAPTRAAPAPVAAE
jgi:hypothetical protein